MRSYYDVIVIGGGINGVLCAIGLEKAGVSTVVLEERDSLLSNMKDRVFAIARRSKEILEFYGVWEEKAGYGKIDHIMIYDEGGCTSVHYDKKFVDNMPMGYVVEAEELAKDIKKGIRFDYITSSPYETLTRSGGFAEVSLADGTKLKASLVICADGKASKLRKLLDMPAIDYNFGQSCIICNIRHGRNHSNTAIEHFYPSGPFAILPMGGGFTSSIVWTEKTITAEKLFNSDNFERELEKKCSFFLGKLELASERKIFNISMSFLKKQFSDRVIFMGDAAHTIHPLAGQGLNLGIREGMAISNILGKYNKLGTDLGQKFILQEIENSRILDNLSMAAVTTITNSLFSSNSLIRKVIRRAAMSIVDMSPLLKRKLMTHAMGISKLCE
ncbi:FAD-dependent monooxygenase [Candidatus Anaplasma sp. TIGMIC]|uniref:FAD-dependent monooxygenase n=1 Tax=Candidatus Anaplasma sp. TIGMIC TaxID=3020713 RepID=UPI002330D2B7|nr:FAD-dependent monooxygenase [Candidatus Anaplasma sp. TIGMIC]MDB1135474.1 FAD-dependent monooxygenase [Candidatus Anaplasma sp. TIGMIC]